MEHVIFISYSCEAQSAEQEWKKEPTAGRSAMLRHSFSA